MIIHNITSLGGNAMRCETDIRQILFSRIDEIKEKFGVERLGIFFLDKNEDINILVEFCRES